MVSFPVRATLFDLKGGGLNMCICKEQLQAPDNN